MKLTLIFKCTKTINTNIPTAFIKIGAMYSNLGSSIIGAKTKYTDIKNTIIGMADGS